ncbi:MAG: UvrD-helicase domain-containing protein, partial [Parcubacteria group bacterium]
MPDSDPYQLAAVTSPAQELSVVAPAGSGKTHVLVERVRWLLNKQKVQPKRVLVLTFAHKAAAELRLRLGASGCSGVTAETFHAWAYRQVKRTHLWPGRLVLEAERHQLLWKLAIRLLRDSRLAVVARELRAIENWSEP